MKNLVVIVLLIISQNFKISYLKKLLVYCAKTVKNARHVIQIIHNFAMSVMMGLHYIRSRMKYLVSAILLRNLFKKALKKLLLYYAQTAKLARHVILRIPSIVMNVMSFLHCSQ